MIDHIIRLIRGCGLQRGGMDGGVFDAMQKEVGLERNRHEVKLGKVGM